MNQHNNPWIALSTYTEDDENRFWGRDDDTLNLLTMLQQNESIIVYAASGDGKSSVINAGLSPAMRNAGLFPISIVFNAEELNGISLPLIFNSDIIDFDTLIWKKIQDSINKYEHKIKRNHNLDEYTVEFVNIETDTNYESACANKLWWKLRTNVIQDSLGITDYIPVLIFDQFEEVLRSPWRAQFFKWLENFMKDIPSTPNGRCISDKTHIRKLFKLILSLRYEYIGELDYWSSQRYFIPQLMQSRYFLKPLTKSQALQIINSTNWTNDEISKKISEYADDIIESIEASNGMTSVSNDEIPAIILSLTCYVLYEELRDDVNFSPSNVALSDIIYDYYKSVTLIIGISSSQRSSLEKILISNKGARLRIPVSDSRLELIGIKDLINGSVNLLSEHILKCEKINGEGYIEFVHDKLAEAILRNREIEIIKLRKEKSKNRYANILIGLIIFLLIGASFLFTRFSLVHSNQDVNNEEIDNTQAAESNDLVIEDLSFEYLATLDLDDATSLKISSKLNTCRSVRDCYKNVCRSYGNYPVIYAHNAKQLTFPYKTNYKYELLFGDNTRKVVILYPHNIESIKTSSPLTEIYVPFNEYEYVLKNPVFDNVNVVRMNMLQTFVEKMAYSMHQEHIHLFGFEMPSWISIGLFTIFFLLLFKNQEWTGYSLKYKLCYTSLSLFLAYLIYILSIEAKWVGMIKTINLGLIVIFAIAESSFILRHTRVKSHARKYKYAITFTNSKGKDFAIRLKNGLVNLGIPDKDINLNLGLFKNGYFDFENFRETIKLSYRTVVIWDAPDVANSTDTFCQSWNVIKSSIKYKYTHPIILGNIDDVSKMPKKLLKKRGTTYMFPLMTIRGENEDNDISNIYTSLHSNLTPYYKHSLKIMALLFLLYFSVCLLLIFGTD